MVESRIIPTCFGLRKEASLERCATAQGDRTLNRDIVRFTELHESLESAL